MSFSQSVRVTVRCHVGEFRKEADLALPVSSSLNELMSEVTDFVGAPSLTRPWRASTAAGRPVDQSAPLSATQLVDGSVVLLSPSEDLPAPVIRDSAEALVHSGSDESARGLLTLWVVLALLAAGAVVGFLGASQVAGAIALAAVTVATGALVVAVWHRRMALAWLIISAASLAAGTSVAGWPFENARSFGHGLVSAALACTVSAIVCHVLNIAHARTTGSALTMSVFLLLAGLTVPNSAGAIIGAAVVLLAIAPGLSTMFAGLRVPQLPTAGQDLDVSDALVDDVDGRSQRAHLTYEGMCLGLTIVAVPALSYLALTSVRTAVVSTLLCLAFCFAVLLHAARHRQIVVTWSLTVLAAVAAIAAPVVVTVADYYGQVHVTLWIAACLPIVLALASPWWEPKISRTSPTMIQWCERLEAVAIVACLPLSAHLAGLFEFIRGLG